MVGLCVGAVGKHGSSAAAARLPTFRAASLQCCVERRRCAHVEGQGGALNRVKVAKRQKRLGMPCVHDFSTSIILIMGNAPCFILFHMCVSFALGNDMFGRIYAEQVGPRSKSKEQLQHLLSCHLALLVHVRLSQLLDFCTLTGSSDYPKPRLLW